jgi:glyoxylase-like metal-dependent hydrolase (beta-lactamase superfamily II)
LPEDERPVVPHPVWASDYRQSIESVRKLAALEPATVWAGHEGALTGEPHAVRARLERAADLAAVTFG